MPQRGKCPQVAPLRRVSVPLKERAVGWEVTSQLYFLLAIEQRGADPAKRDHWSFYIFSCCGGRSEGFSRGMEAERG